MLHASRSQVFGGRSALEVTSSFGAPDDLITVPHGYKHANSDEEIPKNSIGRSVLCRKSFVTVLCGISRPSYPQQGFRET